MTYIYDIETYPNVFTLAAIHAASGTPYVFEISEFCDQSVELKAWFQHLISHNDLMVGYNNLSFDYPIIHGFLALQHSHKEMYETCQNIIGGQRRRVPDRQTFIRQLDLMAINGFHGVGLKDLEFNIRAVSIQDLPYPPGTMLTQNQIDVLKHYNMHDVKQTLEFFKRCDHAISLREVLTAKRGRSFINKSNSQMGRSIFISALEGSGVSCYENGEPRQTDRTDGIRISDVIIDKIQFASPQLKSVLSQMMETTVTGAKGEFKISCDFNGFPMDFGSGGIHGCIESASVRSSTTHTIIDLDVTSYYPSIAIVNGFFPEHLGPQFVKTYKQLLDERLSYKKGSPENYALKIALNSIYGDSGNPYSPFYDQKYKMSITVNGQLMLAMLLEWVASIDGLLPVQANTDGITVLCPNEHIARLESLAKIWQTHTGLNLERQDYSRMWIRDVNNYIAESPSGKLKRKGCYRTVLEMMESGEWHKDMSAAIVPIAASEYFINGTPIEDTIASHSDPMDFMLKSKVGRSMMLMWGDSEVQRISRYYITIQDKGKPLEKVMPPLNPAPITQEELDTLDATKRRLAELKATVASNRKKTAPLYDQLPRLRQERDELKKQTTALSSDINRRKPRHQAICKGQFAHVCNDLTIPGPPINRQWYIEEAKKLVF